MTSLSSTGIASAPSESPKRHLDRPMGIRTILIFLAVMAFGLFFAAYNVYRDISASGTAVTSILPFLLLGVALLIALGFEFVNGFHDTANAIATVIYTHSLAPPVAVVWSGFFNFLGVLVSSGAVAFGIVSLLPVELILQVGSEAGFAMVFAMLIAAIIWNLGTWWLGLPASSSHTMIGSIIGVGIANALMRGRDGNLGRRLEQGDGGRLRVVALPAGRFRLRRGPSHSYEIHYPQTRTLYRAEGEVRAALVDSRIANFHIGRRILRAWLE
jgi:inorganic phosphate transporter, PiT family